MTDDADGMRVIRDASPRGSMARLNADWALGMLARLDDVRCPADEREGYARRAAHYMLAAMDASKAGR